MSNEPYVIEGEWADAEWRAVAARPEALRTPSEQERYLAGPRPHPWGHALYVKQPDGRVFVSPFQGAGVKSPEAPVQAVEPVPAPEAVREPVVAPFADPFHAEHVDPEPSAPVEPDHPASE